MHSFTAAEDSEQARFVAAFDYASGQILRRAKLGSLRFLYFNKDFNRACKTVHKFVDSIIAKALTIGEKDDLKVGKKSGGKSHYNFMEGLLNSMTNPQRLRSELLNILLAGRDTTAGLLSHVFYILARRKDVWAKLEAEIRQLNGRAPSYEQLRSMVYLRCILNESESSRHYQRV